ncbi:MAG: hypothetical protein M1826_005086 [Phylliscum demangeonii]|nr:MAG: hypothetical protein M1826_005086 [Phylliscum demangeonii]
MDLDWPYLDSDMQSRWFDFGGDTIIRADQSVSLLGHGLVSRMAMLIASDRYIRLTADRSSQQGWLFSRVPLTATNWEIEFEFKIHGAGHLYGDGMAMWLTKQRATPGPVFGFTDRFEGLGIVFDTYKNNRPGVPFPYVMAMMGDGHTEYDMKNDGKANELAGCSAQGLRGASHPTKARLTYFQDSHLRLDLQYKGPDEWTECFELKSVTIPSVAYLGFSAHTGELSDNHDIISVEAKNLYTTTPGPPKPAVDGAHVDGPQHATHADPPLGQSPAAGGWGWFLVQLVILALIVGGVYIGYTVWRSQQRGSRF